jgi:fatty-acyl-CoA synthase
VVPKPGRTPAPGDLVQFLSERVARWWLPDSWTFVDEIPKTSVGKFDKKVLRARYAEGSLPVSHAEVPK